MIGRKNKIREGIAERRRESVGVFMLSLPIAIFLVAGRMMTVGREDGFSFAELLAAFVLASVILPIAACAARKVIISGGEERKIGAFERTYRLLLGAAVSVLAFYVAYLGTIELMDFATEVMLLKAPRRAVGIIFWRIVPILRIAARLPSERSRLSCRRLCCRGRCFSLHFRYR